MFVEEKSTGFAETLLIHTPPEVQIQRRGSGDELLVLPLSHILFLDVLFLNLAAGKNACSR